MNIYQQIKMMQNSALPDCLPACMCMAPSTPGSSGPRLPATVSRMITFMFLSPELAFAPVLPLPFAVTHKKGKNELPVEWGHIRVFSVLPLTFRQLLWVNITTGGGGYLMNF